MRLWSLHPSRLDQQGLGGLWREGLGAQRALDQWVRGEPGGYQSHPQLDRFKAHEDPLAAIVFYLVKVHEESVLRGYNFNYNLILPVDYFHVSTIPVTKGQVQYEVEWLREKLIYRSPGDIQRLEYAKHTRVHDLFNEVPGDRESWEKGPEL